MRETTRHALSILLGVAGMCALASPTHAQNPRHFVTMPDAFVRATIDLARVNLPGASMPNGRRVQPETEKDSARPLIPFEDARDVVNAGAASGFAAWCRVDWQARNYQPLMFRQRDGKNRSPKALAFVAVLHGLAKTLVRRDIAQAGDCKAEDRAAIDDYMNQIAGK